MSTGMGKGVARRGRAARAPALIALSTAILGTISAPAAAASSTTDGGKPLLVPSSFELQGSNGYSILVWGVPASKGQAASVKLLVHSKHAGVFYSAPATVTETSIQADLGDLGEISVTFIRSGLPVSPKSKCGRSLSFDSGSFEGKIVFHGEEGYTEAKATSVPGDTGFLLNALCGGIVAGGGGSRFPHGAELYIRNPQLGPRFDFVKTRPGARAYFEINVSEYTDGISIERFLSLAMPSGSFIYSPSLQTAMLRPPAPFSGTAHFDFGKRANRRWSGDLAIDLPGRTDVPLTSRWLRAYLVRP